MIRLVASNRSEELLDALAADLPPAASALFDPAPLVVPNAQVDARVRVGIARRSGVAAGLATRYLRAFLADVAAATAPDVVLVDRALVQGELLGLFHDRRRLEGAELAPVRDYLGAAGDAADAVDLRRFQLSAELGALFDDYAFARPEMLGAWLEGRMAPDLDEQLQRWQRELWRSLLAPGGSFERRGRAEGRRYLTAPAFFAAQPPAGLRVPPAIYLFGLSYVAPLYGRIFAALGQACTLHLYQLDPCREFWEDLDTVRERQARAAARARGARRRRQDDRQLSLSLLGDTDAGAGAHADGGAGADSDARAEADGARGEAEETPALALWGRPGRDNVRLLNELTGCDLSARFCDPLADGAAPTLLTQLQHDVLDRVPARRGRDRLALGDDSITFLPCPDPRRELETIAAEIWALLARDEAARGAAPPLRFDDIAVVVPAAAAGEYLPLASAVLSEASDLPHTIVDAPSSGGGGSRLLEAVGLLLALPLGPLGRQDLLRLCAHPAVAGRFPDADPDDWLALAEELDIVRGADRADHAGTYVEGDRFNWDQGLRRLALGAFLAGARSGEERAFALGGDRYLPAELPPELEASAQGLAILARSLIAFAREAREGTRTLAEWMAFLRQAVAAAIVPAGRDDEAELARVAGELARLETAAADDVRVGYRIACELARAALAALPARAGRRLPEGITVSTFVPMRAAPFRVVFMAGMGEGRFPGPERGGALDLRAGRRRAGDVSPREQDQYLFLETLLGARERVYLSWVDRDPVTGERAAPCSTALELAEILREGYLGEGRGLERPAPPLRRHEDEAACAVFPAAARERRAARLGEALRAAAGGESLPDWPALRARLHPGAVAALAPAVSWPAPPEPRPEAAAAGEPRRVLLLSHLLRFMQCPLQGSARVHLALGDDETEGEARAAYREHEDFETGPRDARPLLRAVLVEALAEGDDDGALARAYDAAADTAVLDGRLPSGTFRRAARDLHLALLRGWRDALAGAGEIEGAPAPLWFGQAPEHLRGVDIQAPVIVDVDVDVDAGGAGGPRPARVHIHGATEPVARVGGQDASIILLTARTKDAGNGRDLLRGWIDHLVLSAAGRAAPGGRRVLMLRPDQRAPEEQLLAPLAPAEARRLLATLAADLLARLYPFFLPCEGVLGWERKKPPRPRLTDYIDMLHGDDWTRFTSDWGPIRGARDYPIPSEEEAQAVVARRFQPLFDARVGRDPR
jgi:exodeoxyribonuclease V gamma subunit